MVAQTSIPRVIGPPQQFSEEEIKGIEAGLVNMDPVSLRALVRQSAHQIDCGEQRYSLAREQTVARMGRARTMLTLALKSWEKRGYGRGQADIAYAYDALKRADEFLKKPGYKGLTAHKPLTGGDLRQLEKVLHERRATRRFLDKDVPDELIDRILSAASWAPNACSLQGSRYIVVRDAAIKRLIIMPWSAPVVIMAGFDERPYEFIKGNEMPYNPYLDLGAGIQSLMLVAHALGLGTCVGSFIGELNAVRQALAAPDHFKLVCYVPVGWPEDEPITVPRLESEAFVSRR